MSLPIPKAKKVESPTSNSQKTLKKVKPRKDVVPDVTAVQTRKKFDDQHVRWTGYLTVDNNRHLRYLLAKGQIPSITRCVNEAVEAHLKRKFGLPPEKRGSSNSG